MKCKLSEKCEFGNLCKDATRHDSLTVLGCASFKTKKPMTNEEWLRQCTTEQLADIFMRFMFDSDFKARFVSGNFYDEFAEWLLKEKHNG